MISLRDFPFIIISADSSVTEAFHIDNSIIKVRNVDALPPTQIALHSHPYYRLTYIDDCDTFTTYVNGCAINFIPESIYFDPPDTLHSPRNQFCGMVSCASLKFYITDESFAKKLGNLPFHAECNDELRALFKELILMSKSAEPDSISLLYENAEKILLNLSDSPKHLICPKDDEYDPQFIKVLKYMYANCGRDIDLGELAKVAHMERTAFAKKFKSLYKITPINYLYSIRLSRSLDYLISDNFSIAEIAKIVGFKRATAFTAAFTRSFEMTPTEYRDKVSKAESFSKMKRV